MEKERKITAPEGCEIEKVEIVNGEAVVTFKEKERELPKSWEEFCKMFPVTEKEYYVTSASEVVNSLKRERTNTRSHIIDANNLPDHATAEAILALCQLIQLRNAYNGDWVPEWKDYRQDKHAIVFCEGKIFSDTVAKDSTILYFKSDDLRDEFLHYFRDLIERIKPLYGIKEGGE